MELHNQLSIPFLTILILTVIKMKVDKILPISDATEYSIKCGYSVLPPYYYLKQKWIILEHVNFYFNRDML